MTPHFSVLSLFLYWRCGVSVGALSFACLGTSLSRPCRSGRKAGPVGLRLFRLPTAGRSGPGPPLARAAEDGETRVCVLPASHTDPDGGVDGGRDLVQLRFGQVIQRKQVELSSTLGSLLSRYSLLGHAGRMKDNSCLSCAPWLRSYSPYLELYHVYSFNF